MSSSMTGFAIRRLVLEETPPPETIESGISVSQIFSSVGVRFPDEALRDRHIALRDELARLFLDGSIAMVRVEKLTSGGRSFQHISTTDLDQTLNDPVTWLASSEATPQSHILVIRAPDHKHTRTPYSWKSVAAVIGIVIGSGFLFTFASVGLILLAQYLRAYWSALPLTYYALFIAFAWTSLAWVVIAPHDAYDRFAGSGGIMLGNYLSQIIVVYPVTFALLCQEIFIFYSPEWFSGVSSPALAEWIHFAYSSWLKSLTFGGSAIYEFGISSIKPANLLAKTIVFAYGIIVTLVLIRGVVEIIKLHSHLRAHAREYMDAFR